MNKKPSPDPKQMIIYEIQMQGNISKRWAEWFGNLHITAEEGVTLAKGEEFGYFLFGGSDIIMLFEPDRVEIAAREMTHYRQGEQIAAAAQ